MVNGNAGRTYESMVESFRAKQVRESKLATREEISHLLN